MVKISKRVLENTQVTDLTVPSADIRLLTADDSNDVALVEGDYPRALYIGGAGDIIVVDLNGEEVVLPVLAGQIIPIRISRLRSTSTIGGESRTTTATDVIGCY